VTPDGTFVGDRRGTFLHALSFVLGFSIVFVVLGASVGLIGFLLYDYLPVIQKLGGILLVIFGLHYMGVFTIPFLYRQMRFDLDADPRLGYFSSFLVGLFFGAGWTPCIGLTLSGILLLAGNAATVGQSGCIAPGGLFGGSGHPLPADRFGPEPHERLAWPAKPAEERGLHR